MIPRVLETEVMDSPAEAMAYDAMDHAEVNRRFVDDFLAAGGATGRAASSSGLSILDLGTGTAQIPIELCRRDRQFAVVAVDAAGSMLELAHGNVANAGLAAQIHLEQADAKHLPFADGQFAAVMSNSIVHHIPEPQGVLAEAVRVIAQDGLIFVRDLMRPADAAQLKALVAQYAAGANSHQKGLFAASLHAALTLDEVQNLVAALGYPKNSVSATSDRHWTWQSRKNAPGGQRAL